MTNEKAISIIKNAFSWYEDNARESEEEDWSGQHEALRMAIQALEQQPNEDAVSRTLVHEAITASIAESENPYEMWQRIEALPSVTPKYTDEEIDKAQAVEQAYVDKMVDLAVKETKRPKGKWISCDILQEFKCSKCRVCFRHKTNYCPNCGSYNGGEKE